MNTLNFFLTLDTTTSDTGPGPCGGNANLDCRGADSDQPLEFTRQRDKLLQALAGLDADVIGLNELENTPGVDPLGDPTDGIVAGLNDILGAGTYDYINTGVIGTDAIRVGLIYRPGRRDAGRRLQAPDSAVDPRFIDTKSRPVARPDVRGERDRRARSPSSSTTSSRRAPAATTSATPTSATARATATRPAGRGRRRSSTGSRPIRPAAATPTS